MGGPGSGKQPGEGKLKPSRARLPRKLRPGWLRRMDQRSRIAQTLNLRLAEIGGDLGGIEELSGIQRSLLERFIHAEALAAQIEERARDGREFDVGQYLSITDRVLRIGQTLGLRRVARKVPTLHEYLAGPPQEPAP